MIVVQLQGGLGNQMFQVAAAKSLAFQNKTEVKLDTTSFNADKLRNFELDKLQISLSFATDEEIQKLKCTNTFTRFIEKIKPYRKKHFYKQPFFHFDKNFFKLGSDVYLKGYFQSEKFFFPFLEKIKKEFEVKDEFVRNVKELAKSLQNENSVAVHVRRGDYKNREVIHYHGILPVDYYKSAIAILKNKIPEAKFYIFSDDPEIVESLSLENASIISGRYSKNQFEDLYLMSHCKHNIIANSSFSWWGAWLNNNPDKIVIAPKRWFDKGPKDTQDLIPEGWIKL